MFSKSCQYALQAVIAIAMQQSTGKAVGLQEIASSQEIPSHFLSKILQLLVKHKVLNSTKGPGGGFRFAKAPEEINLFRIVEIVDGLDIFDRCGIGLKECSDEFPCPIHNEYKLIKNRIRQLLTDKSIAELAEDVEAGNAIISLKQ